ncbi:UDP-4-amino-4,6-dideoxy-N-acetyl-beta-L-altrosamine transaminase [Mariluticola halotolerans]|uniref:UDP-4-amino-4, 6-dideoxy-N-acetyl-beta-L-altrosamine transaminase n=1 Tax=Mariluticola halotolerans TaxID=2909283 RepID=UPI0026E33C56|nr:UDP-4-amino-4,6-dideoxy-N-acetyl-beta-L-altrosamine transaminase [Mariluticola halotolerans]UJQ96053.1 UDP-4-amino-4,6-dideoxy-N-acetyl-beta-L-altrosamine transaminase [Mariluticola halotolerans]
MIPYGRQFISEQDIEAVVDVLRSDFLTQGPAIPAFEQAIAQYCGVAHAIAVSNATAALHIACLALDVGRGDFVWTSPNTFVASANCARYCGASVDFVDVDPKTYNMCPEKLAEKLKEAEKAGTLPKVVIPVHFAGTPCDMARIHTLSEQYGFKIIEDASHAIGSCYEDSRIGDCQFSDIAVFSFHPVKIITSGEGGMATTRSPDLARRLQLYRSHGITREPSELEDVTQGAWYYEQQMLGYNYRLTDLQAALGLSQLQNIEAWITRRHEILAQYDAAFADLPVTRPSYPGNVRSSLHLYPIQVADRRRVFEGMRAAGILVNVHYIPVHTQPDFQKLGFAWGDFPQSEDYYKSAISLPMFASLSDAQCSDVIKTLRDLLQ